MITPLNIQWCSEIVADYQFGLAHISATHAMQFVTYLMLLKWILCVSAVCVCAVTLFLLAYNSNLCMGSQNIHSPDITWLAICIQMRSDAAVSQHFLTLDLVFFPNHWARRRRHVPLSDLPTCVCVCVRGSGWKKSNANFSLGFFLFLSLAPSLYYLALRCVCV